MDNYLGIKGLTDQRAYACKAAAGTRPPRESSGHALLAVICHDIACWYLE